MVYYVCMFIATVPNRNSPPALLLRRSYRENGKVKTQTIANLSHLPAARIEALRKALRGDFDCQEAGGVADRIFGVLFVLVQLAARLGITRSLGRGRMATLALFLVLARVAHRGSRLSAVRWAKDHAVNDVLTLDAFDEDDLYQALSYLAKQQATIEQRLYRRYVQKRGAPPVLVLYDVTSSYLEGQNNALATFGYNRDKKDGKKQIVIGLLTGDDGEPLAVEVFSGNCTDPSTVATQVTKLKVRFGVKEVVFVGDRGMVKAKQKATLSDAGFRYITALTNPQIRALMKARGITPELFDVTVQEVHADGKRLVLRKNEAVAQKEHYRREHKLAALTAHVEKRNRFVVEHPKAKPEAGLKQMQAWTAQHKLSCFVSLRLSDSQMHIEIDDAAKAKTALLDGCYALETDVVLTQMDPATVDARYRDLQKVERDFRTMKTALLEVRPLFVRTEAHTRGAVFVAMLALKIVREMETRLHSRFGTTDDNPTSSVSADEALSMLSRLCYQRIEVKGQSILRLPHPDATQKSVLDALGVSLP